MSQDNEIITKLKQLIADYQPSKQAIDTLNQSNLTIFAGITGAGKNTVMDELLKTGKYHDVVTSTTRQPRLNNGVMEVDEIDYYFLSFQQALEKLQNQEYIEASIVHENVYGVLSEEISRAVESGKKIITDVDVRGVDIFKSLSENVLAIFIIPPSFEVWYERTIARYKTKEEYEEQWPVRHASAVKELKMALSRPYYRFVINGLLSDTMNSVRKVMASRDSMHAKDEEMRAVAEKLLERFQSQSI